jgi:hypothetical protein
VRDECEHVRAVDECAPANFKGAEPSVADQSGDRLPGHIPKPRGFGL